VTRNRPFVAYLDDDDDDDDDDRWWSSSSYQLCSSGFVSS
jgi:hypothetical protein